MDTKNQKGDSGSAAAANILTDIILNSAAKEAVNGLNVDVGNFADPQNNEMNMKEPEKETVSNVLPKNKKEKRKHKKRQEHISNSSWRHLNAFEQRQQKQFTYSVSYFNWAVSDEEEEEDESTHSNSSTSHRIPSSSSNTNSTYSTEINSSEIKRKSKHRIGNEEELRVESEISELSLISSNTRGIVLTEEFIDITLPFKRLNVNKHKPIRK